MNDEQHSNYVMFTSVQTVLNENANIVNAIEILKEEKAVLDSKISPIEETAGLKQNASEGKTDAKHSAEDVLIDMHLKIASALYSHASKSNDVELKKKTKVSKWKLKRMRENNLSIASGSILQLAKENTTVLAKYNITAETLTVFENTIKAYKDSISAQTSGVTKRSAAGKNLDALINETRTYLNEVMDNILESIKDDYQLFYNQYMSARIVKNTGVRHEVKTPAPTPGNPQ